MYCYLSTILIIVSYYNFIFLNAQIITIQDISLTNIEHDKVVLRNETLDLKFTVTMPVFSSEAENLYFQLVDLNDKNHQSLKEEQIHTIPSVIESLLEGNFSKNKMDMQFETKLYNVPEIFFQNVGLNLYIEYSNKTKEYGKNQRSINFVYMYGILTLIPVVVLLILAILLRQALVSLLIGLFLSSMFINKFNPVLGFMRLLDYYLKQGLTDSTNIKIMLTLFLLCGLIGVLQKGGGALALTKMIAKLVKTRTTVQLAAYLASLAIFIDDFASILIVGPNFQPLSDMLFVSREKLAFIVHVMSSPLSCIVPISTWIGTELGLIAIQAGNPENQITIKPFILFLKSIFHCYFIWTLMVFCLATIVFKREFGPMLKAEHRAYFEKLVVKKTDTKQISDQPSDDNVDNPFAPKNGTPLRWFNAVVPIVVIILVTTIALFWTGYIAIKEQESKGEIVEHSISSYAGAGDPAAAMMYSVLLAFIISIIMHYFQKIMSLNESLSVFIDGAKDLVEPLFILFMAWGIGESFKDLKCSRYIVSLATNKLESFLATLIFLVASVVSFSTGTSWGTMSVMFPIVIPLVREVSKNDEVLIGCVGAILSGAIFGDVGSPISGTTIMTSLSCKIVLEDHFFSHFLYIAISALVSIIFAYLPVGLRLYPYYVGLLLSSLAMISILFIFGSRVDTRDPPLIYSFFQCLKSRVLRINNEKTPGLQTELNNTNYPDTQSTNN